MSIFVYYHDDYDCFGLEEFPNKAEAEAFIAQRLASADKPDIEKYKAIDGIKLNLTAATVAVKVSLSR